MSNLIIMKIIANIIISHVAFLAFFGGVAFAFAQEEVTPLALPPNVPSEEPVVVVSEEVEVSADLTGTRTTLNERAQERIVNLAANMSNRIDAVITRMQNIADRIATRIDKLTGADVDTVTATSALASAQLSIDAAREAMVGIDTEVAIAVGAADPRTSWQTVAGTYTEVRDHLKTAHAEIKASVTALQTTQIAAPEIIQDAVDLTTDDAAIIIIE